MKRTYNHLCRKCKHPFNSAKKKHSLCIDCWVEFLRYYPPDDADRIKGIWWHETLSKPHNIKEDYQFPKWLADLIKKSELKQKDFQDSIRSISE